MLAREKKEVCSVAYAISLSSFTAPCPQLMQISGSLVQLMGFVPVFTTWGSGQSRLLQQLRRFNLLFLTTPMVFNSLRCLCDCKQAPCDSGSPSYMESCLHPHLPGYSPGCRLLLVLRHEQLGNPQKISAKSWESGWMRDYDTTMRLSNGHYAGPEVITNGWVRH